MVNKISTLIRQLDIIPLPALETPVTVIGAGAIGSHVVKALAQMGFHNLTVFDEDVIEAENFNCQGYPHSALGKPKVEALAAIVKEYVGIDIKAHRQRYEGGIFPGIVVSAVDNMATRKLIWEEHAGKALNTMAVIDPRMGAESAMLFAMNPMLPEDQETYGKFLYKDEDALREPCTAKATMYTALCLAGMVCKAIKDTVVPMKRYPRVLFWSIRENDWELYPREEAPIPADQAGKAAAAEGPALQAAV
jgi:hypothetical protein